MGQLTSAPHGVGWGFSCTCNPSAGRAVREAGWSLMASHTLGLSWDVWDDWTSTVTGSLSVFLPVSPSKRLS